jgi:hypothetical protein
MNAVRMVISAFFVALIALSVAGWLWTGAYQPASQSAASRVVLTGCIVARVIGLAAVWRARPML